MEALILHTAALAAIFLIAAGVLAWLVILGVGAILRDVDLMDDEA
jgi:hypothetical protein